MAWSDKDLVSFVELNPELRQLLDQKVEISTYNDTVKELDNHIADKVVHITEDERNTWNNSLSEANAHLDSIDRDINTKITNSVTEISTNMSNHINDRKIHISPEDRSYWNSIAESANRYTDSEIMKLSSELRSYMDESIRNLTTKLLSGQLSPITANGCRITISNSYPSNPVKDHEILLMPAKSKICHFNGLNWVDIYSIYK